MTKLDIPAGTWQIDTAHSGVSFSVRHLMVSKVRGRFASFSGTITVAENPLESFVEATVDMSSVDTNDAGRDEHLRTNDFFDIANFPTMTFRSTGVEESGGDYKLHGDLTIKGVTRPVTFDLEVGGVSRDPWGNTKAGFTASGTVNRKDYGMEWNAALETGGVVVGDKVTIELDVEAALQNAPAAV
jgi:polyisoprenoid-binding protein YceI